MRRLHTEKCLNFIYLFIESIKKTFQIFLILLTNFVLKDAVPILLLSRQFKKYGVFDKYVW